MKHTSPQTANKVLLFISNRSLYFQATVDEFAKIIEALRERAPYESDIIDVTNTPELAEKYKVDALPTLIIGDTRFIGRPNAVDVLAYVNRQNKKA